MPKRRAETRQHRFFTPAEAVEHSVMIIQSRKFGRFLLEATSIIRRMPAQFAELGPEGEVWGDTRRIQPKICMDVTRYALSCETAIIR